MKTKHLIAVPLASMGVAGGCSCSAPAVEIRSAQADTLGDLGVVAEVEITSDSQLMQLAMKAKVKGPTE